MNDMVSHLDHSTETATMLVLAGIETMFNARPRWTPEDVAVMREKYPTLGIIGVRPHLRHKTG